jgi:hypothetical protein
MPPLPTCCTCATILVDENEYQDTKTEKPRRNHRPPCCGRIICARCLDVCLPTPLLSAYTSADSTPPAEPALRHLLPLLPDTPPGTRPALVLAAHSPTSICAHRRIPCRRSAHKRARPGTRHTRRRRRRAAAHPAAELLRHRPPAPASTSLWRSGLRRRRHALPSAHG